LYSSINQSNVVAVYSQMKYWLLYTLLILMEIL